MAATLMLKMAVAVAAGKAISELSPLWVASIVSAGFMGAAITLWAKPAGKSEEKQDPAPSKAA